MPRLGGFAPTRFFDPDVLFEAATSASGSSVTRTSLPPGIDREEVLTRLLEMFRERADALPAMLEELRGLMVGRDLTQLINSMVVPAMLGTFNDQESLADGDVTSTWAAKVEYLVGVALSLDPTGDANTPVAVMQRLNQLISDIFEADQMRMFIGSMDNAAPGDGNRELLLYQLRLENQVDRMPGYAVHLEHVDAEVFGRHRKYYVDGLGFDPSDVIRATRLHTRSVNKAFNLALSAVADALNSGAAQATVDELVRKAYDPITLWSPADVAASTGIAADQITAMLDFFSTEYGCQPDFRAPDDVNRARTHPCIKLKDGTYLVPDPWSMSAVIHHRLAAEPKRNGFDPQKYFKHRQDAHERLVAGALVNVFGANVHSTEHYDLAAGDHGEIDSLVCAEWPLVVEAKAIALTESGRRGAPSRVDTKIEAILGKALDQTNRALTYILDERGRSFAPAPNGKLTQLLPDKVSGGTAVIVTFERIDPFAYGGLAVAGNVNRLTWVVSLTDLLMVADVLTDPAAFHHYARTRAGMHVAEASALAEADALGAYLVDRLRILDSAAVDTQLVIGYSCEALNDFYTRQETGLECETPSTGVSDDVVTALAHSLLEPGWVEFVDAVMTADPSMWKKWKNFRRRHRRGGSFTLNNKASLVVSTAGELSLEQNGRSITLSIPS
ncbi:hypothetical protein [Mycolicibacterium sp. A43C]